LEFLYDAVMRDGLPDHWRESYVCKTGKSMKGTLGMAQEELPSPLLIDQRSKRVMACSRQLEME
jgi:hypothetical protein